MPPTHATRDRFTFQLTEMRHGKTAAAAFAAIALDFIQSYRGTPQYEVMLSSILARFLEEDEVVAEDALKVLDGALTNRQNAILEEARANDKERLAKWTPMAAVRNKLEESSSDGEEEIADEEQQKRLKEQQELEEKLWRESNERYQQLQQQKEENEARLRARARQVDSAAIEARLKAQGAVLMNDSKGKQPNNKKGGKQGAGELSEVEMAELVANVTAVVKEKERLSKVLHTSDEELPAALSEAKTTLEAAQAKLATLEPHHPHAKPPAPLTKGQVAQLQQKLSKQMIEKNRLALQLKAMEANSTRDELLSTLSAADEATIKVERLEKEA